MYVLCSLHNPAFRRLSVRRILISLDSIVFCFSFFFFFFFRFFVFHFQSVLYHQFFDSAFHSLHIMDHFEVETCEKKRKTTTNWVTLWTSRMNVLFVSFCCLSIGSVNGTHAAQHSCSHPIFLHPYKMLCTCSIWNIKLYHTQTMYTWHSAAQNTHRNWTTTTAAIARATKKKEKTPNAQHRRTNRLLGMWEKERKMCAPIGRRIQQNTDKFLQYKEYYLLRINEHKETNMEY